MSAVDFSGVRWRKSSYSGSGNDDNCVEVAFLPTTVAVRDSKSPTSTPLTFPATPWSHFVAEVRGWARECRDRL